MILLTSACQKEAEASRIVPLWAGFRVESSANCPWAEVSENIKIASQKKMQGCVIECILNEKGHFVLPDYWEKMLEAFETDSLRYALSFKLPEANPELNPDSVEKAILVILRQIKGYKAKFVALPAGWLTGRLAAEQAQRILMTVRLQTIPLMLAASYEQLADEAFPWKFADQIGLIYLPFVEEDFSKHFKNLNIKINNLTIKNNKSIFILESNILGNRKYELMNNELKFWSDSLSLEGLNFNTLYCKCPLRDSSSYYRLDF